LNSGGLSPLAPLFLLIFQTPILAMRFRDSILTILILTSSLTPQLLKGAGGCACGQTFFKAKFKMSSGAPHEDDKAEFFGPKLASKDTPNQRTATYSTPAHFWLIGSPNYPVYKVKVSIGEEVITGGKTIEISVPCGFEYKEIVQGASGAADIDWQPCSSLLAVFRDDDPAGTTKTFEIKITEGDDSAEDDSEEAGAVPQITGNPTTTYPDINNNYPENPMYPNFHHDTGDGGFALSFPLGRADPDPNTSGNNLTTRRSMGALIISSPNSPNDLVNLSKFKLEVSSSVYDLPGTTAPIYNLAGAITNVAFQNKVVEPTTVPSSNPRIFISPISVITVSKAGGVVTVVTSVNNNGIPGADISTTTLKMEAPIATPMLFDTQLSIEYESNVTGETHSMALATMSLGGAVSIRVNDKRHVTVSYPQYEDPDYDELTYPYRSEAEYEYVDTASGEVLLSQTDSEFRYDGTQKLLTRQTRIVPGGQDLVTDYSYYEGAQGTGQEARRGQLKSRHSSEDGSWAYYGYCYFGGRSASIIYRPFLSTDSSGVETNINAALTAFNGSSGAYSPDPEIPSLVTNSVDGTRRDVSYQKRYWLRSHLPNMVNESYITSGNVDSLVQKNSSEDHFTAPLQVNHPSSALVNVSVHENGSGATSTISERGTFQANVFNAITSSTQKTYFWRTISTQGTLSSSGLGGTSLADRGINVHTNLSTRNVTVSSKFGPVRSSLEIYDGSGFEEASVTEYDYTEDGQLEQVIVDGHVTSLTDYAWNGKEHRDRDGVWTFSAYSANGDLLSAARGTGEGGTPVITTTYQRNGLTSSTLVNGVQVNSTTVDQAGRVTSQTDASGRETSTSYSIGVDGGAVVTTTLPGQLKRISTMHRDGSPVSVTGSAVVDSFYSYDVNKFPGTNELVLRTKAYTGDGTRYQMTMTDHAGESSATVSPDIEGADELISIQHYSPGTLIRSEQTYVGDATSTGVTSTVKLAGSVSHPPLSGNPGLPSAAGALGMSTVSAIHGNGPGVEVTPTDRLYQSTESEYAFIAIPGGDVWTRKTTVVRTLDQQEDEGAAVIPAETHQTVTWSSLSQEFGDFQKIQSSGETHQVVTTYNPVTNVRIMNQTSDASGSSTSTYVAGFLTASSSTMSEGGASSYFYDGLGRQLRVVDARGAVSKTFYNGAGQVSSTEDDDGNPTVYEYYGANHKNAGQVESVTDPLGKTTIYTYNDHGQVLTVGGTASYPLEYFYNVKGEMETLKTTYGVGNSTSVTHWAYHPERAGLLETKTLNHGAGDAEAYSYTYHFHGKVKGITSSGIIRNFYDTDGGGAESIYGDILRVSEMKDLETDNMLAYTYNSYGQANKVVQTIKNDGFPGTGTSKTFTYYNVHHANGTLASEKRGSLTGAETGVAGLATDLRPLSSRISYEQDPSNQNRTRSHQIEVLRPKTLNSSAWEVIGGTRMDYDSFTGRLWSVESNEKGPLSQNYPWYSHIYDYNSGDHKPSQVTAHSWGHMVFNSTQVFNRMGQVTNVVSRTFDYYYVPELRTAVGYKYNSVGQRTKATRENGFYWGYGYNDRGEVTSAKKHHHAGDELLGGLQFEYEYDAIGNRKEMKYGGDKAGGDLQTVTYGVNGHNQYSGITNNDNTTNDYSLYITGHKPATSAVEINGNAVTATETQGSFFFKKLQESNNITPAFLPISMEETPPGGPMVPTDLQDVFIPKKVVTPVYDRGNLINDGRWVYKWTANNRLSRMTPTQDAQDAYEDAHDDDPLNIPDISLPTLDFLYDWKGRRMSKMVTYTGADDPPSTVTTYIYDGWNIVGTIERNDDDRDLEIVRPIWGLDYSGSFQGAGGVGGLLVTRTTKVNYSANSLVETSVQYPSYDANGNIIAWTTEYGGKVTTRDFDAFGNIVTNQGSRWSPSTAFGFSTKYEDVETGLLYYGYRYYDPVTGRWPSRDPLGDEAFFNQYSKGLGEDEIAALKIESRKNPYAFIENSSPYNFDIFGLLSFKEAEKVLKEYNTVDYLTMKTGEVWKYLGGHMYQSFIDGVYYNSCALRLSIAWAKSGKNLKGQHGANNAVIYPDDEGSYTDPKILGGTKHVIISSGSMVRYLRKTLGPATFKTVKEYDAAKEAGNIGAGDVLFWGRATAPPAKGEEEGIIGHVGMGTCGNTLVGSSMVGEVWQIKKP
jgi:RHS repeat-associated protein